MQPQPLEDGNDWGADIQARFWSQLERFQPENFVASGVRFVFVTNNRDLYERAVKAKLGAL